MLNYKINQLCDAESLWKSYRLCLLLVWIGAYLLSLCMECWLAGVNEVIAE
jgi:hypothetical protein